MAAGPEVHRRGVGLGALVAAGRQLRLDIIGVHLRRVDEDDELPPGGVSGDAEHALGEEVCRSELGVGTELELENRVHLLGALLRRRGPSPCPVGALDLGGDHSAGLERFRPLHGGSAFRRGLHDLGPADTAPGRSP